MCLHEFYIIMYDYKTHNYKKRYKLYHTLFNTAFEILKKKLSPVTKMLADKIPRTSSSFITLFYKAVLRNHK